MTKNLNPAKVAIAVVRAMVGCRSDRFAAATIVPIRSFCRSESGAATIDMVVLAAAVVGIALAAALTIASSTTELAAQAGATIASVYDDDTSGSTGNTESGGDEGGGNGHGWAWGRGGKWGS